MFSLGHLGEHGLNAYRPSPWGSLSALTLVQRHRDEHVLCDRYRKCAVGGEAGGQCVWGENQGRPPGEGMPGLTQPWSDTPVFRSCPHEKKSPWESGFPHPSTGTGTLQKVAE